MNNENYYFVWLSSLNLRPITKLNLLRYYGSPRKLFETTKEEFEEKLNTNNLGVDEKYRKRLIAKITDISNKNSIDDKINQMRKLEINMITYLDDRYPKTMKQIFDFPVCLYYKGNIELLTSKIKIAMIGCRNYSDYGKQVALDFSKRLAKENFVVVSGCARGIDSFSHIGTLEYKKSTIAVLGNSIEYVYPPENKNLEDRILDQEGLILSEYLVGTKPTKYTFPSRNRIISGISDGVLVIEANEKSGTLITVDFALEQGKTIYAIPGNITNTNSIGTNNLIKLGAKAVTKIEDILEDF